MNVPGNKAFLVFANQHSFKGYMVASHYLTRYKKGSCSCNGSNHSNYGKISLTQSHFPCNQWSEMHLRIQEETKLLSSQHSCPSADMLELSGPHLESICSYFPPNHNTHGDLSPQTRSESSWWERRQKSHLKPYTLEISNLIDVGISFLANSRSL